MGHCSHSPRKTCLIQAREEDKKKLTSTVMFCGNPRKTALLQSGGLKSKYRVFHEKCIFLERSKAHF